MSLPDGVDSLHVGLGCKQAVALDDVDVRHFKSCHIDWDSSFWQLHNVQTSWHIPSTARAGLGMRSGAGRSCRGFPLPHLVVLHHSLQHGPCVFKDVSHALEQRDAHNAEEAHLHMQFCYPTCPAIPHSSTQGLCVVLKYMLKRQT